MTGEVIDGAILDFRVKGDQAISTLGQIEDAATRMERGAKQAANRMADNIAGIGKGAASGTASVEAASKRFVASVEREINSITMSRAAYRQWEAQAKGISETVYAPLIQRLEQAKTAQDAQARSLGSLGDAFSGLGAKVGSLNALLGAAGLSVGAQQYVALGKELINAQVQAEALQTTLNFATAGAGARELDYLRKTSNALGLEFGTTATSFAKFAAAAKETALEGEGARRVFDAVAKASAVLGLSTEDNQGVLLALGQMISKGTVQAEELRGQLGERLPGAFQVAARAMGVTTSELGKLLEQGLVPASEFLPKFARQLEQEFAGSAEAAADRTGAAVNRLANAWERARQVQAAGLAASSRGVMDTVALAINELSASMDRAQKEGAGFYGQITAGQLALLGLVNPLSTSANSAELLAERLKDAQTEVESLQAAVQKNPGDILLGGMLKEAREVLATLRAAKEAKDQLGTGQDAGFKQAGSAIGALAKSGQEAEANAAKIFAEARSQLLGVNTAYLKQVYELNAQREKGLVTENDYVTTVQKLTAEAYKGLTAQGLAAQAASVNAKFALEEERSRGALVHLQAQYELGLVREVDLIERTAALDIAALERKKQQLQALKAFAASQPNNRAEVIGLQGQIDVVDEQVTNRRTKARDDEAAAARRQSIAIRDGMLALREEGQQAIDQQLDQQRQQRNALARSIEDYARGVDDSAMALQLEATFLGASDRQRSEAVDLLRIELDLRRRIRQIEATPFDSQADRQAEIDRANDIASRARVVASARAAATEWQRTAEKISSGLTDAILDGLHGGRDGLKDFGDEIVKMFEKMVLRPQIELGMQWLVSQGGAALGVSGAGGASGYGGANSLSTLNTLYGAGKSGWGWLTGSSATAGAGSTAAFTSSATTAPMAEYAGTAAAGGSSAASAIPIIGWIVAAIMASNAAYKGGNTIDMLDKSDRDLGVGAFETHKYETLSKLGFSDKWAQILSGAPLTARLFGHKASSSGYGIGTVSQGDFITDSITPFQYGDNTLGTGRSADLEGLSSDLIASLGLSASQFGGRLQEGLRVGSFTDRDREGKVSALLGYFGSQNTLIAGTQTGTGAFGVGGPGAGGQKIEGADFQKWVAEQMPVLLVEGLQQSDLSDRFSTYFDSIAASTLTSEQATQMLNTASAVAKLTEAFDPLGGALSQLSELSVDSFQKLANASGGFDALGQSLQNYYQQFYSEAERTDDAWASITKTLNAVGIDTIPKTREGFRALVDSLDDLGSTADQQTFAALMKVSGAFDALVDSADAAAEKVKGQLTKSISEAINRFGTTQERQGQSFGGISTSLQRDAGVTVSIAQLMGASRDDIETFARAFVALSTVTDAAKVAVLDAASALADLKDQASDQRSSLEIELLRAQGRELDAVTIERQAEIDQLRNLEGSLGVAAGSFTKLQEEIYAASDAAKVLSGLDNVISDFLKGEDLAKFRAGRIQQTLAGGGITGITIERIMGATTEDIVGLWNSVGDAGKSAILDSYSLLNQLQTDLTKEQGKALQDQLSGMKGLRDLSKDIKQFLGTMKFGDLSPLSAEAQLTEARKLFDSTFSKAQGGDTNAQGQLLSNAQAYLQELQSAFASGPAFTAEFNRVTSMLDALGMQGDALDPQIKYLESLSDNSRDMLDALLSIDTTLKGGTSTPSGVGRTGYVDGPPGSSGGLSGSNGGVVDIAPMRWADSAKSNELLQEQVQQLTAAVAELKALNTVSSAGVATQQAAAKQTGQKLDALLGPLEQMAGTARQDANKRSVMPVTR